MYSITAFSANHVEDLSCHRAFKEHLDSQVCRASRAIVSTGRFDNLGFLLPNVNNDYFLGAMSLLEIWKEGSKSAFEGAGSFHPSIVTMDLRRPGDEDSHKSQERMVWKLVVFKQFSNCNLGRTVKDQKGLLRAYSTALVLCFLSFAVCCSHEDLNAYLQLWTFEIGVAAMLRDKLHNASCPCSSASKCSSLRNSVRQDSSHCHLMRTLRDNGLANLRFKMLMYSSTSFAKLFEPEFGSIDLVRSVFQDWVQPNEVDDEWPHLRRLGWVRSETTIYG